MRLSAVLPLAGLLSLFLVVAWGCESTGVTPDCPPMPIVSGGPNAPEIVEWREEAVALGCATAAGDSDQGGSAGGASEGTAGSAGSEN